MACPKTWQGVWSFSLASALVCYRKVLTDLYTIWGKTYVYQEEVQRKPSAISRQMAFQKSFMKPLKKAYRQTGIWQMLAEGVTTTGDCITPKGMQQSARPCREAENSRNPGRRLLSQRALYINLQTFNRLCNDCNNERWGIAFTVRRGPNNILRETYHAHWKKLM